MRWPRVTTAARSAAYLTVVLLVSSSASCSTSSDRATAPTALTDVVTTSGAPTTGATTPAATEAGLVPEVAGWPSIHHDRANSDTTSAPSSRSYRLAYQALDGWRTFAIPSTSADRLHLLASADGQGCHLVTLDAPTGERLGCSDAVGGTAIGSTALIDDDGNLYVGDDTAMVSLDPTGEVRWRAPLAGLPLSSQLTGEGHLLLVTHRGRVMILDRAGGHVLADRELLPGAGEGPEPGSLLGCFGGDTDGGCPSANTPAIDPATGRVYLTLNRPGMADGALVALDARDGEAATLATQWESPVLEGGSAGSPTLSADGQRVYTTDRAGHVIAVEADTGTLAWRHDIGYSAGGSPSVAPDGVIVPAGGRVGHVLALRDEGDRARVLWERPDLVHRGLAVQAVGPDRPELVYAAVVVGAVVHLAVLDRITGETVDLVSTESGLGASMGTAVGDDGSIYLTTPLNGIFAFAPDDPDPDHGTGG